MAALLIGALAIVAGAFVQATLGFGIALVAVPVLVLTMAPTLVTPMMIVLGLLNNLVVLAVSWRDVRLRLLLPLAAAGLVCLPLGVLTLKYMDAPPLKLGVGVLTIIVAIVMIRREVLNTAAGAAERSPSSVAAGVTPAVQMAPGVPRATRSAALLAIGGVGGVLHSAVFLSGPPIVLFLANRGTDKAAFRATLIAYFTVMNISSVVLFSVTGLLSWHALRLAAWYTPALIAGSLAGVWLAGRINQQVFTRAVLVLVALLGLTLVAANLPAVLP